VPEGLEVWADSGRIIQVCADQHVCERLFVCVHFLYALGQDFGKCCWFAQSFKQQCDGDLWDAAGFQSNVHTCSMELV
jgi:hypothetical protein